MTSQSPLVFSKELLLESYYNLSNSPDKAQRDYANFYILELQKSPAAWQISREIFLNCAENPLKFLGIQILTKKIKSEFATLPADAQNSLKEQIFSQLNNENLRAFRLVFMQLCASAALIALFLLTTSWPNFFDDLFEFMQKTPGNLEAGLEILENFVAQLDQIVLEKKRLVRIRSLIFEETPAKFVNFFEFLLKTRTLQPQTLRTLKTWVSAKLQILELSSQILESLLELFGESEETTENVTEIVTDALKNSRHAEILDSTQLASAVKLLSPAERGNLQRIIEFLGVKNLQAFTQSLSSAPASTFSRCFAEILTVLAEKFVVVVLENTEFSHAVIKLLLMVTSHADLAVSHFTFDFWVSFYHILLKHVPDAKLPSQDYLIAPFVDVFKIVFEKCKLRSLKLKEKAAYSSSKKSKNSAVLAENSLEVEEAEENAGNRVTLQAYRSYSEDIFYNVYRVLSEFRGNAGIQLFFAMISERLQRSFYSQQFSGCKEQEIVNEYLVGCEAALFAAKSMLDNIIFFESNPWVHGILSVVIGGLPYEAVVVKTALQFVYDASEQLKFSGDIIENVYKYVLQFIVDENMGKLASQCFNALTENLPLHQLNSVGDIVYEFIAQNIDGLQDDFIYENLIQGLFNIGWKIADPIANKTYIARNLGLIDNKFAAFNDSQDKNLQIFKKICNMMISALLSLEFQTEKTAQYDVKAVMEPFLERNLEKLSIYFLELSSVLEFVELFTRLFKLILKFSEKITRNYFSLIFTTTFKLFQSNAKQNSFVLGVFSFALSILENDPSLGLWLQENYSEFNRFLLKTLENFKDPDLIKNFANLQAKILLYDELIFLNSKEYDEIMRLLLESLLTISEYAMNREILLFFNSFVGVPKGQNHQRTLQFLPEILKVLVFLLPEINRNFVIYEIQILQAVAKSYSNGNELALFVRGLLNDERFHACSDKQKDIFVQCMFHFLESNRQMKVFFNDFTNFLNKNATEDVFMSMEMQLKDSLQKKSVGGG